MKEGRALGGFFPSELPVSRGERCAFKEQKGGLLPLDSRPAFLARSARLLSMDTPCQGKQSRGPSREATGYRAQASKELFSSSLNLRDVTLG